MKINWVKHNWLFFIISLIFILPGIYSLVSWGLRPSIDFIGGTLLEIKSKGLKKELIIDRAQKQELGLKAVSKTADDSFLLKFSELGDEDKNNLLTSLNQAIGQESEIIRWESLGPSLGQELFVKTGMSIFLAILVILIFINLQFKDKSFGICAILAMLHDTLILLGSFSLFGHFLGVEVDTLFVTAVLTILSFSVHDTVVVYDRIRELLESYPKKPFFEVANMAINQTLVRSINNSLTIIFMLVALVFLGGETIHWFAAALLIGTIAGTYSSTFTAVPLLVVWKKLFKKS